MSQPLLALIVLGPLVILLLRFWFKHKPDKRGAQNRTRLETMRPPVPAKRQVWHSSYAFAGSLRHVALFVGKQKYEIRRDAESQEIKFSTKSYPTVVDAASFSVGTHFYDKDTDATSPVVGAAGPFSLYLGDRQQSLQFNFIGLTTLEDSSILQLCEKLDKTFVYNLLSNNCHDFAMTLAFGLVKPEDRTAAWDILFGPRDYQLGVLAKVRGTSDRLQLAYVLYSQNSDAANHGGIGDPYAAGGFNLNDFSGGTASGGGDSGGATSGGGDWGGFHGGGAH